MDNNNSFYSKVFGWLFVGILVTFVSAYLVSNSYDVYFYQREFIRCLKLRR